jgi:hypothetical protein
MAVQYNVDYIIYLFILLSYLNRILLAFEILQMSMNLYSKEVAFSME